MIKPMLCKTQIDPFDSPDYIFERKYDGARIIAEVDGKTVKLYGRSGNIKTGLFPELKILTAYPAILDGEVISGEGFAGIQHRINRQNGIQLASQEYPAVYQVFDILKLRAPLETVDLGRQPLSNRKLILEKILVPTNNVVVAPYWDTNGTQLFETAKKEQWEGIVGKRKMGTYQQNKREWLKIKIWQTGKFLAVGYTQGTGWRSSTFGALVLSDSKGNYVGSVGTGFNEQDISDIMKMFAPGSCPFPREPEPATWIRPFAVTIRFMEFTNDRSRFEEFMNTNDRSRFEEFMNTNDRRLRFPSFKGVV